MFWSGYFTQTAAPRDKRSVDFKWVADDGNLGDISRVDGAQVAEEKKKVTSKIWTELIRLK